MQEAAKDLVKTEEDEIGEEHEEERRKEDGMVEEGGPDLIDDVGDTEEELGVDTLEDGAGEVAGVDCRGDML